MLSALVILLAMPLAHAAVPEVCIQSQAALIQALNDVRYTAERLNIVAATYNIDSSPWYNYNNDFMQPGTSLRGGYGFGCFSRNIAPGNTVFTATSDGPAIFDLVGNLTIEGLTFDLPNGLLINADQDDYALAPNTQLRISRSEFTGGGFFGGLRIEWNESNDVGGAVNIENSLFVENIGSVSALDLATESGNPVYTLANNTVYHNPVGDGAGSVVGVRMENHPPVGFDDFGDGDGVLLAHNNIFYGNGNVDLYADTPNMELVDNIIGTKQCPLQNVAPIGTLTVDPKLGADYRPIESPISPAINSGETDTGNLPATDMDGGPRVIGVHVDRGAYESNIDDSIDIKVTNTNDDGPGSLRYAINGANQHGDNNFILFAIGNSCGPHVITLQSPLPALTGSVFIDGYSQPGAAPNTLEVGDDAVLCVVLDGAANSIGVGLQLGPSASSTADRTVRGIAFSGFTGSAIELDGGGKHAVKGVHIGGAIAGATLAPSKFGVYLSAGVKGAQIGDEAYVDRNIIGATTFSGIYIAGPGSGSTPAASANQIVNNYLGVGWNIGSADFVARGNGTDGIHVLGNGNTISGNLIGDNGNDGIDLDGSNAHDNVISGNDIGVDDDATNLGNSKAGVRIDNAAHDNTVRFNHIANNGGSGVRIETGKGNSIRRNMIGQNTGLGIDLDVAGVMPNDNDGAIVGLDYANRGQNFPLLTQAVGAKDSGSVSGTLTTTQGDITIDLYSSGSCDSSNHGPGARWLGSRVVTVPAPGGSQTQASVAFKIAFALSPPATLSSGAQITATATDTNGNTSEFSSCIDYLKDVIFANGFN